jgi:hypothetical protein
MNLVLPMRALDFIAANALNVIHVMKLSVVVFSALLLTLSFSGCEDKEKEVIVIPDEKPKDIFSVTLCETLHASVMSMLSESGNNSEKYPQLFTNDAQGQIILTKESDVYITYVTESASVPSTLGFYTYTSNAPSSVDDVSRQVALPHVSSAVLAPGDSRRIGHFPAGTTIGFFLVVGGYHDNTVNWNKPTFWTNFNWNEGSLRQHVLFREQDCNNVIMAFEDKNRVTGSDNDFNDIVFIISDNGNNQATTSFDLNSVPEM